MSKQFIAADEFVGLIAKYQSQLRGFIFASLGDYSNTSDVLQQTNVVLWQKSSELASADEFLPWALTIAKFKILSFVRDRQRERLVFYPELAEAMIDVAFGMNEELSDRHVALRSCLEVLPDSKLQILKRRYVANEPLKQIAHDSGRTVNAVKGRLKRIRKLLSECVDRRIAETDTYGLH